ncbi:hypothetical protein Cob_v004942 [Colletotrichum orbiculare MAFF 240422]|uniref:Uncharacterized protein n=1 Tax=Colletotrichum orbiculare (strain 104-T / ATCC 96160 / CBS 514.97 / LARS 414 / MAFF 240422) TaxID=1213857 RepID=A0A484FX20_COLOR|nr:hypothetical protein Cob_v004942 [Colletotrichum orbiculare MAFF 240422]
MLVFFSSASSESGEPREKYVVWTVRQGKQRARNKAFRRGLTLNPGLLSWLFFFVSTRPKQVSYHALAYRLLGRFSSSALLLRQPPLAYDPPASGLGYVLR